MRRLARWAGRVVAGVVLVALALWLLAYSQQWLLRCRAERLLADITALQVKTGTWADVQRFRARWGKWGNYYGTCDAAGCEYRVTILDAPLRPWGPKNQWSTYGWMLDTLGLRFQAIQGQVTIRHSQIVAKGFIAEMGSPPFLLRVASFEEPTLSPYKERASHPNHQDRLDKNYSFSAAFTPDEEPTQKATLMQFDFHCLTALRLCAEPGEMLPVAYKEYLSEGVISEAERNACSVPFRVWARDETAVLEGDVLQAKRPDDSPQDNATWLVTLHVTTMLKGKLRIPLDQPLVMQVQGIPPGQTGNFPYKTLVAAGDPVFDEAYGDPLENGPCEVVEATPKNIADAKRGVQEDFDPHLPPAENFIAK
jgi:hypothetical protein